MPKQATGWDQIKVALDAVDKAYANLPAPPSPRDSWSEKVNLLHRTLEGMREQVRSEVENEDANRQGDEA